MTVNIKFMIILDNTPLLTWEVQRCIKRLESTIFNTDVYFADQNLLIQKKTDPVWVSV